MNELDEATLILLKLVMEDKPSTYAGQDAREVFETRHGVTPILAGGSKTPRERAEEMYQLMKQNRMSLQEVIGELIQAVSEKLIQRDGVSEREVRRIGLEGRLMAYEMTLPGRKRHKGLRRAKGLLGAGKLEQVEALMEEFDEEIKALRTVHASTSKKRDN